MFQSLRNWSKVGGALLAVLAVGLLPAAAHAESLVLRNETNSPIIVQAGCVVRGVLRRDRPYLLRPGEATPPVTLPGNKLITVYDGQHPNLALFQGTIAAGPNDQMFGVCPDGSGVKLDLKATPPGP